MKSKTAILIGGSVFSYGGWYLGALFGEFGIPLLFSLIAGVVGVILTWKLINWFS